MRLRMLRLALFAFCGLVLLPGVSRGQDASAGEDIFKRKCQMCHRLSDETKVGPGLAGVTVRRTEPWINEWLENPKAMIDKGDPVALELVKKYKKPMSKLPAMESEENRKNVIAFLRENDQKKKE